MSEAILKLDKIGYKKKYEAKDVISYQKKFDGIGFTKEIIIRDNGNIQINALGSGYALITPQELNALSSLQPIATNEVNTKVSTQIKDYAKEVEAKERLETFMNTAREKFKGYGIASDYELLFKDIEIIINHQTLQQLTVADKQQSCEFKSEDVEEVLRNLLNEFPNDMVEYIDNEYVTVLKTYIAQMEQQIKDLTSNNSLLRQENKDLSYEADITFHTLINKKEGTVTISEERFNELDKNDIELYKVKQLLDEIELDITEVDNEKYYWFIIYKQPYQVSRVFYTILKQMKDIGGK